MRNSEIERVAETHYFIRHVLKRALTNYELTSGAKETFPGCSTYWDIWTQRFSQKFFDMGTLIRAAASVETFLRDYYAYKKGYQNLSQLRQDRKYKKIFFNASCLGTRKMELYPCYLMSGLTLRNYPIFQQSKS